MADDPKRDDRDAPGAASEAAPGGPTPRLSDKGRERVADRQARQAEALRANLRRRKDQMRARESGPDDKE